MKRLAFFGIVIHYSDIRCREVEGRKVAQLIRARFERGVLKPLQRLRLKKKEICLVSIYPEAQWRLHFDALLTRLRKPTSRYRPASIESDITAARAEVRAKRRAARRAV